jgi:hypothetical protein
MVQKVFRCQNRAIKKELIIGVAVIKTSAPWWQKCEKFSNSKIWRGKKGIVVNFGA